MLIISGRAVVMSYNMISVVSLLVLIAQGLLRCELIKRERHVKVRAQPSKATAPMVMPARTRAMTRAGHMVSVNPANRVTLSAQEAMLKLKNADRRNQSVARAATNEDA
ncbi:hypothetical protein ACP4OV_011958 [Aristida adscensionis]